MRGVLIPGLGMAASELPDLTGFLRLENPEFGSDAAWVAEYSLEEVAEFHLRSIKKLSIDISIPFHIVGMSMGGMVASVLASRLRGHLPKQTKFRFLVTSPNLAMRPAVPDSLLKTWYEVRPGSIEGFTGIMAPFFSDAFRSGNAEKALAYYEYRATGKNGQSARAFIRQLSALRRFDGALFFAAADPSEATFIGGAEDYILGPGHSLALKELCPEALHTEIFGLGHMINIERPELFIPEVGYGAL